MKDSPTNGRRKVVDGLSQLLEQVRAAEELPAELCLKLVRGYARGTRLLARGDLSDLDPGFTDILSVLVCDLRSLVTSRKPQIAAALIKRNLLPTKSLTETLQSFLQKSQQDKQDEQEAARYLQLRDDLELLRDGLGSLDLIHEELQTCLALADEQYFQDLEPFDCVSVYADRFMASFGVDPDRDGPFGFWAAVADSSKAMRWR